MPDFKHLRNMWIKIDLVIDMFTNSCLLEKQMQSIYNRGCIDVII